MKKDGEPVEDEPVVEDMVNNDSENAEAADGERSSVGGRGRTTRRGSVQCKLPLSRIPEFMASPRIMCLFCDRSFLNAVLLQKHTNSRHRVDPARRVSARNIDQQNMSSHNYPGCNFCNNKALAVQKTDDLPALFHHLLDVHSLKYFGCRICQQRFSDGSQLKLHNQTNHPELLQTSISSNNSSGNSTGVDVECAPHVQLPISETINEKDNNVSLQNNYDSFETDLCNLNAKVSTKRVYLSEPSKSSTPILKNSDNKKDLRSRRTSSKTRNSKTLAEEISPIPPDTRPQPGKDVQTKINSSDTKKMQDAIVLIPPPPPPRDGYKVTTRKHGVSEKEELNCESIDKKLSKMSRAAVHLTPVKIKTASNNDPQILSRLGLVQNRSPRAQSLRRNRKVTSADTRSSEASRRDKVKGKNDCEFVINKNRIDPGSKFDPDFYASVSDNVRENLLKHLDGKLEKSNVACDVPDVIDPKIRSTHAVLEGSLPKQPAEIHGSDVALNAITIFPTILAPDQYGSDKVPHYTYGANTQGFKKTIRKNSWKWKWDITKKLKQIQDVGKRDLSRLDIWTQLTMRERYDKCISSHNQNCDELSADTEKAERQRQITELNTIMERRVFPDIQSELKLSERQEDMNVEEESVGVKCEKTDVKLDETTPEEVEFMRALGLTINDNNEKHQESTVFSGEWQRPRCYVCCVCGIRADCLRLMEAHQGSQHPYAQATYYELVGKEALDNQLYKHLYIFGVKKITSNVQKKLANRNNNPRKIIKVNQPTRILRTTARNIKLQERLCTKCKKMLLPSEVYKHILECAGDYGWMMSKKKCKSKPFGVRRRRLKGLYKRERPQDGEATEKNLAPRPKISLPPRPRSKPSDVETIQKMLANLPAKRASKQVLNLPSPKARKVLSSRHSRILRRILPDSTLVKRPKTTVIRTIKGGKLRRVTRSVTSNDGVNANNKESDSSLKKTKPNIKSKKDCDEKTEEPIPNDTPKPAIALQSRKKRNVTVNMAKTRVSNNKEKEIETVSKNDASCAVITEDNLEGKSDDSQGRLLRRRPENITSPKKFRRRSKKNDQIIDKSGDSNSENTQDNCISTVPVSDNKNDIESPVEKSSDVNAKNQTEISGMKKKSKKVLGLPLKWIGGKKGRVSRIKKKKIDSLNQISGVKDNLSNKEINEPVQTETSSVNMVSSLKANDSNVQTEDEIKTSAVEMGGVLKNNNLENRLPAVSLSTDPSHTNTNLGFSNFGQSFNTGNSDQSQYQHLYNSTAKGDNVSNMSGKTSVMTYNAEIGYYYPGCNPVIEHKKLDKTFERTNTLCTADDFALDNIDKPPLFSSVRAQSQIKDNSVVPTGYLPSSLAKQKAFMHVETNYELAHNQSSKSKIPNNKSKRGLNDCIAMLRGKLTAQNSNEIENSPVAPNNLSIAEESNSSSSQYDESIQPLDLSGRCQAEDLSLSRRNDRPENLTIPKPHSDWQEVQDLSMKSVVKSTPTKSALLNVRKPVFDPTLRIPQFSAPVDSVVMKPSTSSSSYVARSSASSSLSPVLNSQYPTAVPPLVQTGIDLASNISHELALLPQALVNTIEKLPPLQQEEIVKVLPQVLVKAVENYKRQNEQEEILKNMSAMTKATPIDMLPKESPATREEHVRPRPVSLPQTSEISTQTAVLLKEEGVQKCPPEFKTINTDLYLIEPIPGLTSERKIDKIPNRIVESIGVLAVKPRGPHEVIDLTDDNIAKEPEEVIPAAIIEKPKDSETNVRSVVIMDPLSLDKSKLLDQNKSTKGTASLRAVRIKSTSEKMKIKNMSLCDKPDVLPPLIAKSNPTTVFIPRKINELASKSVIDKVVPENGDFVSVQPQPSRENTITSSKDRASENLESLDPNVLEFVEPAIQQDEVSSTQHSSVEDNSDASTDAAIKTSKNHMKLSSAQTKSKTSASVTKSNDLPEDAETDVEKCVDKSVIDVTVSDVSASKSEKQKSNSRRKRACKVSKEKKAIETNESNKLKENTVEKDKMKEVLTVVEKRDKGEPKTSDMESDKKTSFNNLLKECNSLSESALTPSNVMDYHTERKALDKCENIQISEPVHDDVDADRNTSVRRSLRTKKTILKETRASIDKDTNIYEENRDNSNDVEPIPDVPGAIIPEESYKANLGNTTDNVEESAEKSVIPVTSNREESDDDDVCLAVFSKKITSKATQSVMEKSSDLDDDTKAADDKTIKNEPKKCVDRKKPQRRNKKKVIDVKSTAEKAAELDSEFPIMVDSQLVTNVPTPIAFPKLPDKFTQLEENTNTQKDDVVDKPPIIEAEILEDSKKDTRKSGRLKTQKDNFASIDSVKLSENGHLIFKMHKEPKLTENDIVPKVNNESMSDTTTSSVEIHSKLEVTKTASPRVKRSSKTFKNDEKTVTVPPLVDAINDQEITPQTKVTNDQLTRDTQSLVECNKYEMQVVLTQTPKKRNRKQSKEKVITPSKVDNASHEDESDKPLIALKDKLVVNKLDAVNDSPKTTKKSRALKNQNLPPVPDKVSEIETDKINKITDISLPTLISKESEIKDNSSDEDVVLCKLVEKKKLKTPKRRSSPRAAEISKDLTQPSGVNLDTPQEQIDNGIDNNPPVTALPESRKISRIRGNAAKKNDVPEVVDNIPPPTPQNIVDVDKSVEEEDMAMSEDVIKPRKTRERICKNANSPQKDLHSCDPPGFEAVFPTKTKKAAYRKTPNETNDDINTTLETNRCDTPKKTPAKGDRLPSSPTNESNVVTETPSIEKVSSGRKLRRSPLKKDSTKDIHEVIKETIPVTQANEDGKAITEIVVSPRRTARKIFADKDQLQSSVMDKESPPKEEQTKSLIESIPESVNQRKGKRTLAYKQVKSGNLGKKTGNRLQATGKDATVELSRVSLVLDSVSKKLCSLKNTEIDDNLMVDEKTASKKGKGTAKDDSVEITNPDVPSPSRRGGKKSDKPDEIKTKGSLKDDVTSLPKSNDVIEPHVTPRRSQKKSATQFYDQQIKDDSDCESRTRSSFKDMIEITAQITVPEPLKETLISNSSPRQTKKKSILERELSAQLKSTEFKPDGPLKNVSEEVPFKSERITSPRKVKNKALTETKMQILNTDVEKIEESVDKNETILAPAVEENFFTRRSKKSPTPKSVVEISTDKIEDILPKTVRKARNAVISYSEEEPKTPSVLLVDECKTKNNRRKSSRALYKETLFDDKPIASDTIPNISTPINETLNDGCGDIDKISSAEPVKSESEDKKSKARTSIRSLSKPKSGSIISDSETFVDKKSQVSVDSSNCLSCDIETSVPQKKNRDLLPIIIDTTPKRNCKVNKKNKKNLQKELKVVVPETKECLVSLNELEVDCLNQDVKEPSISISSELNDESKLLCEVNEQQQSLKLSDIINPDIINRCKLTPQKVEKPKKGNKKKDVDLIEPIQMSSLSDLNSIEPTNREILYDSIDPKEKVNKRKSQTDIASKSTSKKQQILHADIHIHTKELNEDEYIRDLDQFKSSKRDKIKKSKKSTVKTNPEGELCTDKLNKLDSSPVDKVSSIKISKKRISNKDLESSQQSDEVIKSKPSRVTDVEDVKELMNINIGDNPIDSPKEPKQGKTSLKKSKKHSHKDDLLTKESTELKTVSAIDEIIKKCKKHKKKSTIKCNKPSFNDEDDLSSEEPLQYIVEENKLIYGLNEKLFEEEFSDKTDSSICLANLVPQKKSKKKKSKIDKSTTEICSLKSMKSVDNKNNNLADDSLSDSDSLMKLKSDKLKGGIKRKNKSIDSIQKSKHTHLDDKTPLFGDENKMEAKNETISDTNSRPMITTSSNLPTDVESLQDKYLADFGMYTEKRPRKSTLVAMKRISKSFKPDGEELSPWTLVSEDSGDGKSGDEAKTKKPVSNKSKKVTDDIKITEKEKEKNAPKELSTLKSQQQSMLEKNVILGKRESVDSACEKFSNNQSPDDKLDVLQKSETPVTVDTEDIPPKKQMKKSSGENYCALCKKKFRTQENYSKHLMTLIHISRVSEVEAMERDNMNKQSKSPLLNVEKSQPDEPLKIPSQTRVHRNLAERKSFDTKTDMDTDIVTNSLKQVQEMGSNASQSPPKSMIEVSTKSSRKTLSRDEALFFECCSLLKESSDIPINNSESYPLTSEQNNSSSDSTPYISGVKNILKASKLLPPSLTGESDNTMELSQTDSNSEIPQSFASERVFAFANKNESDARNENGSCSRFKRFLVADALFGAAKKTIDADSDIKKSSSEDFDPYSAESLMVRTNSDDFSDNGDSMISSQDTETTTTQSANKSQPNVTSDKSIYQPVLINEFEDKFDKIKRKAREKAQAAQEAMAAVISQPRNHTKKSSKKSSSKSRKLGAEKKCSQRSLLKSHKLKNKTKKKNISSAVEKGNSKKVLTKAALKGFDSVKVSISSGELNFQDVLDSKHNTHHLHLEKDGDSKQSFDIDDSNSDMLTKRFCIPKKVISSLGKSGSKDKQKSLLNFDTKDADSIIVNDKHDVYEFMDDDEDNMSDSFKFRTPTVINKTVINKKGESVPVSTTAACSKVSLDVQNDDSQISSLSFSDRDDFTYMSDDYNGHDSEDETNHSSNSLEGSATVSKSSKKRRKSSKLRNIQKNAIMGKIFKNAIKSSDQSPSGNGEMGNTEGIIGSQTDMDQLFDSLFEQAIPDNNQIAESDSKPPAGNTDTDDMDSATEEVQEENIRKSNPRSPSGCESDSDNDDHNPIPAYPRTSQRKIVPRLKARSSDDEAPPQSILNKSDIVGIASHKSQRKCTTGKQNVLVESWSSESDFEDYRQFEEYSSIPRPQKHHRRPRRSGRHKQTEHSKIEQSDSLVSKQMIEDASNTEEDENKLAANFESSVESTEVVSKKDENEPLIIKHDMDSLNTSCGRGVHIPNNVLCKNSKNSKRKRRQSQKPFDYDDEFKPIKISEPLTTQRRNKRPASEMLYYWSSSSDDEEKVASNDISSREPEHVEQHGWIVGDSHKKLVTMLAHAKGRKVDDNASVKEKKSRPTS